MKSKIYKCCLCGTIQKGYGNNPAPLVIDDKSKCCDLCNGKVIQARFIAAWEQDENMQHATNNP